MGIHICIEDKGGNEHPDWDYTRQGDDRENVKILSADSEQWPSERSFYGDDRLLLRPTPTTKLVGKRGLEMLEILKDPKWWVHVSY